jgi:hypothetical protein
MSATDATALNSPVRRFWRTVSVVILSMVVIGLTVPNAFIFANNGLLNVVLGRAWTVTKVYSPASASLRVGDRIDPASLTPDDRLTLNANRYFAAGQVLHLSIERAGQRRAISIRWPGNPGGRFRVLAWLKRLTASIFIVVGALLVLMRPCRMTWGFFLFALGSTGGDPYVVQAISPAIYNAVWLIFTSVFAGLGLAGFWIFTARFPNDSTSGWRSQIDRFAPLAGLVETVIQSLSNLGWVSGWQSLNSWNVAGGALTTTTYIVGMLSLVGGYFHMTASQRQRLKWVIAGFSIALAADAYQLAANYLPDGGWPASWGSAGYTVDVLNGLNLAIPATVAYAVLKHHVLDVNFVISRALVLGTLTTVLVGAFALVDWFFSKAVEQQRLAFYAEVVVALGFGFGLNSLHRRVDAFTDRVLFHRRHLAEARLERIALGISHAVSIAAIDAALVEEPAAAFQLTSAAIFRKQDGNAFLRAAAVGWSSDTGITLQPDDPVVLHMQGERAPLRLRDLGRYPDYFPNHAAAPIIAFPLLVRHQLEGLAVYGAHISGEDIDPDETRILERLSKSAAAAYDHLEAEAARREVSTLKTKVIELQRQISAIGVSG